MYKVLIADDDPEDRELLKLEITRALAPVESDLRFAEAASVKQALTLLTAQVFDLLTLDIEFDRLSEGLDALPEIFEIFPALNIIVVSGKLDKGEVSGRLFRFTKDNVLKSKRWVRHFDVLDKKDDKADALLRAHSFAAGQSKGAGQLRDLFLQAESYLEQNMIDKCIEVYQRIQRLAPGEPESAENIRIVKGGMSLAHAREYRRNGEAIIAALILGHFLEDRIRTFTAKTLGRSWPALGECVNELEKSGRIGRKRLAVLGLLLRLRNKSIHHPATVTESDFDWAEQKVSFLEEILP
jgi:CheY-like chemotaxis protein